MEYRIPGALGQSPFEDLRGYITKTDLPALQISPYSGLPPIQPDGHKSHANRITAHYEPWMRLEGIYKIFNDGLNDDYIGPCKLHATTKLTISTDSSAKS